MIRVTVTPEVAEMLKQIDETKARIASLPTPPKSVLRRMMREFLRETAYYAVKLSRPPVGGTPWTNSPPSEGNHTSVNDSTA